MVESTPDSGRDRPAAHTEGVRERRDPASGASGEQMASGPLLREGLGRVLRMRRTALGLTLQEVAGRAGVSVQYLSEVERGLKDASSEMIAAIVGALGLELCDVLVLTAQLATPAMLRTPAAPPAPFAASQAGLALAA